MSERVQPEELEAWISEVKGTLGLEDEIDIAAVLDLAKDFAHDVARPAAPLTTLALGIALGRAGENSPDEFRRLGEKLRNLAAGWQDR